MTATLSDEEVSTSNDQGSPSSGGQPFSPQTPPQRRRGPVLSQAIPFVACPPVLVDCDLAGNVGFDPLSLASSKEQLLEYRESEVKHGRLAMLAAAGWPLSELLDRNIADYFGVPTTLDNADRVPSLLNGGLENITPEFWGACLGMSAAIDLYGVQKSRSGDPSYFPGNLGYDPLNLYPRTQDAQRQMQLAEIKHGRLAMLAVVGYASQESVSRVGVVDETPFFFFPITESAAQFLQEMVN